jgi:hypothetical protein
VIIQVFAASKRDDVRSFDVESEEGHWGESTRLASDGSEYLTHYAESLALDFPRRRRSAVESCSAH